MPSHRHARRPGQQQSSTDDIRPSQVSDQQPVQPLPTSAANAEAKPRGRGAAAVAAGAGVPRATPSGAKQAEVVGGARVHDQRLLQKGLPEADAARGAATAAGGGGIAGKKGDGGCRVKGSEEAAVAVPAATGGETPVLQLQHVHGYTGKHLGNLTGFMFSAYKLSHLLAGNWETQEPYPLGS